MAPRTRMMLAICVVFAALGCARVGDPALARGSTVVVASYGGSEVLNPSSGLTSRFLVFLPLVAYDEHGELQGRLARSWEHSDDYREWTYHLRTDVRWHDGVLVTAHDVKFTLDLLVHPDVAYYPPGAVSSRVIDDSTISVRYAGLPSDTWTVYYPKHVLEGLDPADFYAWRFWRQPVGDGPYRFVRYVPETMMEFEADPGYFGGKPAIERVVLKFGGTGVTEILSGGVDVVQVNETDMPKLVADPRFRFYHTMTGAAWAIFWQHKDPLFEDARVRRALTLAINRPELVGALNLPRETPIVDGPYTDRQLKRRDLLDPLPYDPAQAIALLESAGWRPQGGGGIRERGGKEFRFTALVDGSSVGSKLAVLVQEQLRRVGVQMDVQTLESTVVRERLAAGDFKAALTLSGSVPIWLQRDFGEESPFGYHNPRLLELIDRAAETLQPDAQDAIYREIAAILRADQPITYLHWWTITTAVHRRVEGLSDPWWTDPMTYMADLRIADEQ